MVFIIHIIFFIILILVIVVLTIVMEQAFFRVIFVAIIPQLVILPRGFITSKVIIENL